MLLVFNTLFASHILRLRAFVNISTCYSKDDLISELFLLGHLISNFFLKSLRLLNQVTCTIKFVPDAAEGPILEISCINFVN